MHNTLSSPLATLILHGCAERVAGVQEFLVLSDNNNGTVRSESCSTKSYSKSYYYVRSS